MISALAELPLARLLRTPRPLFAAAGWCAVAVVAAIVVRVRGASHGADAVLPVLYGALAAPLLAYALSGAALGGGPLRASVAPLVAFGASPPRATAFAVAVASTTCAVALAVLAAIVALIAHGSSDPPAVRDALTSAYAGALGGLAYGAWFSLGAGFGRRGGGRAAMLAIDWILGATGWAPALVTPRAHLRSLLGGAPPLGLSGRESAIALLVLAALAALAATRRATPKPFARRT